MLPLMREGLEVDWQRGFMAGSREAAHPHVTGLFLGWKVPGIFDVEVQLHNLSLKMLFNKPEVCPNEGRRRRTHAASRT